MTTYELLEEELVKWTGMPYAVVCSSGTAALHLALEAFQLPRYTSVAMPDYTMVACARAAVLADLKPVLVDCREATGALDSHQLERALIQGLGITAVMYVHVYGRPSPVCWTPNYIPVIEDMAEMHGIAPNPRSDAACYSFYKNKVVHGEEGGAVLFRLKKHADLARQLRCQGFTPEHDYTHVPRGHNYRLADSLTVQILHSLMEIDTNLYRRQQCEGWYDEYCPAEWRRPKRASPWMYDVRVPGIDRTKQTQVVRALQDAGVAARFGFVPMSMQQEFLGNTYVGEDVSKMLMSEVVTLPLTYTDRMYAEDAVKLLERVVRS